MLVIRKEFTFTTYGLGSPESFQNTTEAYACGKIEMCAYDLREIFDIPEGQKKITLELHTTPGVDRAKVILGDYGAISQSICFVCPHSEHNLKYSSGKRREPHRWIEVAALRGIKKYCGKTLYLSCFYWE